MIAINKCYNCECTDETLLGICIECVETIMGRLDSIPEPKNSQPMIPTSGNKCRCTYGTKGVKEKVAALIEDCEEATVRVYERNYAKAKRLRANK
jgi:hypothetical protein